MNEGNLNIPSGESGKELRFPDCPGYKGDLLVPHGYFSSLENEILSSIAQTPEEQYFAKQEEQILSRIHLERLKSLPDLDIPAGYFERLDDVILRKTGAPELKWSFRGGFSSAPVRWIVYAASAAAVAAIGYFIWTSGNETGNPTFAQLLESAEITDLDLPYFADEEDYYTVYLSEIDEFSGDTLVVPVAGQQQEPQAGTEVPDNRVHADSLFDPSVKPIQAEDDLKWEDLSEEEILLFLLEESDDDMWNELN